MKRIATGAALAAGAALIVAWILTQVPWTLPVGWCLLILGTIIAGP